MAASRLRAPAGFDRGRDQDRAAGARTGGPMNNGNRARQSSRAGGGRRARLLRNRAGAYRPLGSGSALVRALLPAPAPASASNTRPSQLAAGSSKERATDRPTDRQDGAPARSCRQSAPRAGRCNCGDNKYQHWIYQAHAGRPARLPSGRPHGAGARKRAVAEWEQTRRRERFLLPPRLYNDDYSLASLSRRPAQTKAPAKCADYAR